MFSLVQRRAATLHIVCYGYCHSLFVPPNSSGAEIFFCIEEQVLLKWTLFPNHFNLSEKSSGKRYKLNSKPKHFQGLFTFGKSLKSFLDIFIFGLELFSFYFMLLNYGFLL